MITTRRVMWKFRCTLQWIKNLLGWILLILFFVSLGWLIIYLIESASQQYKKMGEHRIDYHFSRNSRITSSDARLR
jgi:SNF family Na+-dependent transporter